MGIFRDFLTPICVGELTRISHACLPNSPTEEIEQAGVGVPRLARTRSTIAGALDAPSVFPQPPAWARRAACWKRSASSARLAQAGAVLGCFWVDRDSAELPHAFQQARGTKRNPKHQLAQRPTSFAQLSNANVAEQETVRRRGSRLVERDIHSALRSHPLSRRLCH